MAKDRTTKAKKADRFKVFTVAEHGPGAQQIADDYAESLNNGHPDWHCRTDGQCTRLCWNYKEARVAEVKTDEFTVYPPYCDNYSYNGPQQ